MEMIFRSIVILLCIMCLHNTIAAALCPYFEGCTFLNSDCTSIKCVESVDGIQVIEKMKINTCEDDISVEISLSVPSIGFSFTKKFTSTTDIPIPGLSLGPLGKVVWRIKMNRDDDKNFKLTVQLVVKTIVGEEAFPVIDSNLGKLKKSIDCGFFPWLNDESTGVKFGIYGGLAFLVLSIVGCIACCCCCGKRRQEGGIIVFGSRPQPTPATNELSTVVTTPYEKF